MQNATSGSQGTCVECGARRVDGLTWWEQLGLLIAWEYEDPTLQAVHFLSVAAYNLQHPAQFTEEGLANLQAVFVEHIDHGLAVSEIRRRVGRVSAGHQRVLRTVVEQRPILRQWNMTINDVYIPDLSSGAATRVRAWGAVFEVSFSEYRSRFASNAPVR